MAKLIKLQDAAELALNLIKAVQTECDGEDAEDVAAEDFNQFSINAINETHREALLRIAQHLLISDKDNFNELTPQDQALWNSFPTVDIYEFLTGQREEFPEFKANWTTPSDSITYLLFNLVYFSLINQNLGALNLEIYLNTSENLSEKRSTSTNKYAYSNHKIKVQTKQLPDTKLDSLF